MGVIPQAMNDKPSVHRYAVCCMTVSGALGSAAQVGEQRLQAEEQASDQATGCPGWRWSRQGARQVMREV